MLALHHCQAFTLQVIHKLTYFVKKRIGECILWLISHQVYIPSSKHSEIEQSHNLVLQVPAFCFFVFLGFVFSCFWITCIFEFSSFLEVYFLVKFEEEILCRHAFEVSDL